MAGVKRFGLVFGTIGVVALVALIAWKTQPLSAMQPKVEEVEEPAPPEGQTYIGAKKCAACHFEQYMSWKKDKHSKAFDLLTDAYAENAECLECHTTGYGQPTGYKRTADKQLAGVTCEACHGPGSKHAEVCEQFAKKKLSEEEEKVARDSIWKMTPHNVCVHCHITKGHHKSKTPKELRKK